MTGLRWLRVPALAALMALAAMGASVGLGGTTVAAAATSVRSAPTQGTAATTAQLVAAVESATGVQPEMICGPGPGTCGAVFYLEAGYFNIWSGGKHEYGNASKYYAGGFVGCSFGFFGAAVIAAIAPVGGWIVAGSIAVACLSGGAGGALAELIIS